MIRQISILMRAVIILFFLLGVVMPAKALHQHVPTYDQTYIEGGGNILFLQSAFGDSTINYCDPFFCDQLDYLSVGAFMGGVFIIPPPDIEGDTRDFVGSQVSLWSGGISIPNSSISKQFAFGFNGPPEGKAGDGTSIPVTSLLFDDTSYFSSINTLVPGFSTSAVSPLLLTGSAGTLLFASSEFEATVFQPGTLLEVNFLDPDPINYLSVNPNVDLAQQLLNDFSGGNTVVSMLFDGVNERIDIYGYRLETGEQFLMASNMTVPLPPAIFLFISAVATFGLFIKKRDRND